MQQALGASFLWLGAAETLTAQGSSYPWEKGMGRIADCAAGGWNE